MEPHQNFAYAPVIRSDYLAQVFGIEPRRQRGRADEIAENYRQLSPLSFRKRLKNRVRSVQYW